MEDKCKFCGRGPKPFSSASKDHCYWVGKYADDLKGLRSISCYETELATLKALVRDMGEVLIPLDRFVGLLATSGASWTRGQMIDLNVKTQEIINRCEVKAIMEGE
jgi:hypothetical protein